MVRKKPCAFRGNYSRSFFQGQGDLFPDLSLIDAAAGMLLVETHGSPISNLMMPLTCATESAIFLMPDIGALDLVPSRYVPTN
jgi:hypothetical protein